METKRGARLRELSFVYSRAAEGVGATRTFYIRNIIYVT